MLSKRMCGLAAACLAVMGMLACGSDHQPGDERIGDSQQKLKVSELGLFEIDNPANATNDPAITGDDWQNLVGVAALGGQTNASTVPGFIVASRVVDGSGSQSIFTGGGSKDINDISQWRWTNNSGGLPDKDNITNAYAAAYKSGDDLILYFGADRFDNSGDAQLGFWFFKNTVSLVGTSSGTFSGVHAEGDILVLVNFTKGGTVNNISVRKWSNGALQDIESADAGTAFFCDQSGFACASTNSVNTPSYWPYTSKSGSQNSFPPQTFFEGGINITQLLGETPCISSFLAESRSSQSDTATLKDFALGSFDTCPKPATINLKKLNENGGNLGGAVLQLFYDADNSGTLTAGDTQIGSNCTTSDTDGIGTCTFTVDKSGNYIAHELTAPSGYNLASDVVQAVTISTTPQTITIQISDSRITGRIDIIKKDDAGNLLDAATFTLVETGQSCTTVAGKCSITGVNFGTYTVHESTVPPGVDPAPDQTAQIQTDGQIVTLTFIDPSFRVIVFVCRNSSHTLYSSNVNSQMSLASGQLPAGLTESVLCNSTALGAEFLQKAGAANATAYTVNIPQP